MTENVPPDDAAPTHEMTSGDPLASGPEHPRSSTPPPDEPPPRRYLRSRDDRIIAGVCGGLARYFGIDVVLVRLAVVVLALFGGAGALLYLGAAILVPVGDAGSVARPPRAADHNRVLTIIGLVALVLVVGPLLLIPAGIAAGLLVPLGFLALLGAAVAWLVTGRRPEAEAGSIARATLIGLGVLVLLGCLSVAAFWTAGLGGGAVVAGLVIAAGVAVLVGAFLRPVRWLVLPALAIALPAAFVSAAGIDLDGGYGERSYRPVTASQLAERYELGAGEMRIDLRGLDLPAGDQELELDLGIGDAVLIVDEDVCVATDARMGAGLVEIFDREHGGVDVVVEDMTQAAPGRARLVVDADIGLGHLDVRHTEPAWSEVHLDDDDWLDGPGHPDHPDRPFDDDASGNRACAGATS